jgi:hypothetical protein
MIAENRKKFPDKFAGGNVCFFTMQDCIPETIGRNIICLSACFNTAFTINTSILINNHCIVRLVGIGAYNTGAKQFTFNLAYRDQGKKCSACQDTGNLKAKIQKTPPFFAGYLPGLKGFSVLVVASAFHFIICQNE